MFTDTIQDEPGSGDQLIVDIAPMLDDESLKQTLGDVNLDVQRR